MGSLLCDALPWRYVEVSLPICRLTACIAIRLRFCHVRRVIEPARAPSSSIQGGNLSNGAGYESRVFKEVLLRLNPLLVLSVRSVVADLAIEVVMEEPDAFCLPSISDFRSSSPDFRCSVRLGRF